MTAADETMKVVAIVGERQVEVLDVPRPKPRAHEVLVKVGSSALCTWEQRTYSGVDKETPKPFVGGHEFAGEVVDMGPDANTTLQVGDKVAIGPRGLGEDEGHDYIHHHDDLWGTFGLAEYRAVSVGRAYKLADGLSLDHGCLSEPIACVIRSMDRLSLDYGEDVVVIGAGVMGLLNMKLAKLRGARVIVSEIDDARLAVAKKLGADETVNASDGSAPDRVREVTNGRGADVVIVAIGNDRANLDALSMVGEFGRVMFFASAHPATDLTLDPNVIHRRQITLTGARHPSVEGFRRATRLLSKGLLDVGPLIEARVPVADAQRAFDLAIEPDSFRVIVNF